MCLQVREALAVGCIGFSAGFFCNTMTVPEIRKIIEDELRNFCVLVEQPKTPFGKSAPAGRPTRCLLVCSTHERDGRYRNRGMAANSKLQWHTNQIAWEAKNRRVHIQGLSTLANP